MSRYRPLSTRPIWSVMRDMTTERGYPVGQTGRAMPPPSARRHVAAVDAARGRRRWCRRGAGRGVAVSGRTSSRPACGSCSIVCLALKWLFAWRVLPPQPRRRLRPAPARGDHRRGRPRRRPTRTRWPALALGGTALTVVVLLLASLHAFPTPRSLTADHEDLCLTPALLPRSAVDWRYRICVAVALPRGRQRRAPSPSSARRPTTATPPSWPAGPTSSSSSSRPGRRGPAAVRDRHRPRAGLRGRADRQRHGDPHRRAAPRADARTRCSSRPARARSIEELPAGQNCVTAVVWKSADGRRAIGPTFPWCFDVT